MIILFLIALVYTGFTQPMTSNTPVTTAEIANAIKNDAELINEMHDAVQQAIVTFSVSAQEYPPFCNRTMHRLKQHESDLLVAVINADIAQSSFDEETYIQHRISKTFVALDRTSKTLSHVYDFLSKLEAHLNLLLNKEKPFSQTWYSMVGKSGQITAQKDLIRATHDKFKHAHARLTLSL